MNVTEFNCFVVSKCTAVISYLRPEFKFRAKIEIAFYQMLAIKSWSNELQKFLDQKPSHISAPKNEKIAFKIRNQNITNDDKVSTPSRSSIVCTGTVVNTL